MLTVNQTWDPKPGRIEDCVRHLVFTDSVRALGSPAVFKGAIGQNVDLFALTFQLFVPLSLSDPSTDGAKLL